MATKTLGIDLGTNSIGWAIVENQETSKRLLDRGVNIFQVGMKVEKNVESPTVSKRTEARASRRKYFRQRCRKIKLLEILVEQKMCPPLSDDDLKLWRTKKLFPLNEDFIEWIHTSDNDDRNPYHDRHRCLHQRLNLDDEADRFTLGRALYHLAQRRGFLSNRKDPGEGSDDKDSETGKVKKSISELSAEMNACGCEYLGDYFYRLYGTGTRIRNRYTARKEHYLAEFDQICRTQQLDDALVRRLHNAIFYQRPLKSQKGSVGHCTFEKGKPRCNLSHPAFEQFRMLQVLNNIRIRRPGDAEFRSLNAEERQSAEPLFYRKSKPKFEFAEIAAAIAGKKTPRAFRESANPDAVLFNYPDTFTVTGSPVTARIREAFGNDYMAALRRDCKIADGKSDSQLVNDLWHALYSFDDEDALQKWLTDNYGLSADAARKLAKPLPQGYASLSLNAISKILPWLLRGMRYDQAVFLANLKAVLPADLWNSPDDREAVVEDIAAIVDDYSSNPLRKEYTLRQLICDRLLEIPEVEPRRLSRLYQPSVVEAYPAATADGQGRLMLGSPRNDGLRNPVVMRALFRLRHLVNALLASGKIDRHTIVNVEMARELNDANRRKAIYDYERNREKENLAYAAEIAKLYREETGRTIEPTETDIQKYRLWKEQEGICLYTGQQIGVADFIGADPRFDIEHTVPRSKNGADALANKTLCECRFNRDVKQALIPAQLRNHAEILARIESLGWNGKIESLRKKISSLSHKQRATKKAKDRNIVEIHLLRMELDYWVTKIKAFTIKEVNGGFANRQAVDIGIISKYAIPYLHTVFEKVFTVKGATTAEFRKLWGLQDRNEKKVRDTHLHHCIDAITIACIGRNEYQNWAQYQADQERYRWLKGAEPVFPMPWPGFAADVRNTMAEVLVKHISQPDMIRQTKKKFRKRGKVQYSDRRDEEGNPIPLYLQGDTARARLHEDTLLGAIRVDGEEKYVLRKSLATLKDEKEAAKIVDPVVRAKVLDAIGRLGFKDAMASTIYMNEALKIPIRKVRVFTSVTNPLDLKQQRFESKHPYKNMVHVDNDSNYCLAVYEGINAKGKRKMRFKVITNLDAARKLNSHAAVKEDIIPLSDGDGFDLKYFLRTGDMVLLYENSPQELYQADSRELQRRLYKVRGLDKYGRMKLISATEARRTTDLQIKKGAYKSGEILRPFIGITYLQFNAMIEGVDFKLGLDGEVTFMR